MPFDGSFDPLRLNANIALSNSGGGMLQQTLDKGNIIPVVLVDLGGIPLPEAVGADALIAQIIAYDFQFLLYCSCGEGEDELVSANAISQAVVFDVLGDDERDSEHSAFCLSFAPGSQDGICHRP